MPPDIALASRAARSPALPEAWRLPLMRLAAAWAGLAALTWGEWAEMAHQWWNASTYNHILLVPFILAWLVRLRWTELAKLAPTAWWPGLAWLGAGAFLWQAGIAAQVNLVAQAGAVMLFQAVVPVLLGPRVAAGLLFPLGYMAFLVPFGDEIVPALQTITAKLAIALTHASGVPAQIEGIFIDTPAGLFRVAEACSGVKFLVAMVALGALVAHLHFAGWRKRALFMAACVAVPVLANGVRAWGTIYIAQSQGIEFAAGFDHIVYGWVFFAVVMGAMLMVARRFADRSPDARPFEAAALAGSPALTRAARHGLAGWAALAIVLLIPALAALALDLAPARP